MANNGDMLMHQVLHDTCSDLGISLTSRSQEADFVAIPPNGALLDRFRAPELIRQRLQPFRDRPVVVFPSSAQFLHSDPSNIFENRSAPTIWILREPYSFEHLTTDWGERLTQAGVELTLDHDVVISGAHHVPKYFESEDSRPGGHESALLVSRLGVEAQDIRNHDKSGIESYETRAGTQLRRLIVSTARSLPPTVFRPIRKITTRSRIQSANDALLAAVPRHIQGRFDARARKSGTDISDTTLASFDEFCARIASAESVLTNRLHVAIPASLLGKETVLVDSGYHKLRGIYEHSLQDLDNLTFISRS